MSHCDAISLEDFSAELKPIVRIINDWVTTRLALIFEVQAGNGKLLVCGADLFTDNENPPRSTTTFDDFKNVCCLRKVQSD